MSFPWLIKIMICPQNFGESDLFPRPLNGAKNAQLFCLLLLNRFATTYSFARRYLEEVIVSRRWVSRKMRKRKGTTALREWTRLFIWERLFGATRNFSFFWRPSLLGTCKKWLLEINGYFSNKPAKLPPPPKPTTPTFRASSCASHRYVVWLYWPRRTDFIAFSPYR